MTLQLIVIHYDEDESYIKELLDVLKLQQNVDFNDFEVLVENDGDKLVYDTKLFENYPFSIQYHVNPWSGRSGVRQCGLDRATAEYVMFCDCDDTFIRFDAMYDILSTLKVQKPDLLMTKFRTNFINKKGYTDSFRDYICENVWIHGKCFRTAFLKDNNIRWNVALNEFEDSWFVRLVDSYPMKSRLKIDEPTYMWKYRPTSCTRNEGSFSMLDYKNKIKSEIMLVDELWQRGLYEAAGRFCYATTYAFYFANVAHMFGEDLSRDYSTDMDEVEKIYLNFYTSHKQMLDFVDEETKSILFCTLTDRFFKDYNRANLPKLSFDDWLVKLKEKHNVITDNCSAL